MQLTETLAARREASEGTCYALAAYGGWALFPLYIKSVAGVPVLELMAHRVVWSLLLVALIVLLARRGGMIAAALADRRTLLMMGLSTAILSCTWWIFIWAVANGQVLQTSLGYYINPLFSVVLGVSVLGERLKPLQVAAVLLAALGVANLAFGLDELPWAALGLALTFSLYGLIRKTARIGALDGMLVETALMLPFALGFLGWLAVAGSGVFAMESRTTDLLLVLAGPVTLLPLVWFSSAARRLPLSVVAFFQFIAPTGHFLLAVFAFDEPFTRAHLVTFLLIWSAVALFLWQSLRSGRRAPVAPA